MDTAQEITGYACELFDVAACSSRLSSGDSLLILGLVSRPDQDLDEFGLLKGVFQIYGFEKHVSPRLERLLTSIRDKGFHAEAVGWYGYPDGKTLNLKQEAIRAGLGKRGKNTLVLHPKYGLWLRFAAIRTDAPLELTAAPVPAEEVSPFCSDCSVCIDVCPVSALEPYHMPNTSLCLSNVSIMPEEHDRLIPCDKCLHMCQAKGEKGTWAS